MTESPLPSEGTVRRRRQAVLPLTPAVARLTESGQRGPTLPSSCPESPELVETRSKSSSLDSRDSREWVEMRSPEEGSVESVQGSLSQQRLSHVVHELLSTEQDYCGDLRHMITGYAEPLSFGIGSPVRPGLTCDEHETLFGNMPPLLKLHSELLAEMERCAVPDSSDGSATSESLLLGEEAAAGVASALLASSEQFSCYSQYCNNYPRAMKLLSTWSKNESVSTYLEAQQKRLGHRLPLAAFLLKPVQRVLKYHLLLQSLLSSLPEESDSRPAVSSALAALTHVAHDVNELKRRDEHAVRAQEITSVLEGWQGPDPADWGDLVIENTFRVSGVKTSRHLLLFEKVLVILKRREDGAMIYKDHIVCSNLMLIESVPKEPLAFHVLPFDSPRSQHTVLARTISQKRRWCQELKRLILENFGAEIPEGARKIVMETGAGKPPQARQAPCAEAWESSPLADGGGRKHSIPEYLEKRKLRRKSSTLQLSDRLKLSRRLSGPSILQTHQELNDCELGEQDTDSVELKPDSSSMDSKADTDSVDTKPDTESVGSKPEAEAEEPVSGVEHPSPAPLRGAAPLPPWPEDEDAGYATLEGGAKVAIGAKDCGSCRQTLAASQSCPTRLSVDPCSSPQHCDSAPSGLIDNPTASHGRATSHEDSDGEPRLYQVLPRLAPRALPEELSLYSADETCGEDPVWETRQFRNANSPRRPLRETALLDPLLLLDPPQAPVASCALLRRVTRQRSFSRGRKKQPQHVRYSCGYELNSQSSGSAASGLAALEEPCTASQDPPTTADFAAAQKTSAGGWRLIRRLASFASRLKSRKENGKHSEVSLPARHELARMLQEVEGVGQKMAELRPSAECGPYTLRRRRRLAQAERRDEQHRALPTQPSSTEKTRTLPQSQSDELSAQCEDERDSCVRLRSPRQDVAPPTWRDSSAVYEDQVIDALEQLEQLDADSSDDEAPVTAGRSTVSAGALLEQVRDSAFYSDGEEVPRLKQQQKSDTALCRASVGLSPLGLLKPCSPRLRSSSPPTWRPRSLHVDL